MDKNQSKLYFLNKKRYKNYLFIYFRRQQFFFVYFNVRNFEMLNLKILSKWNIITIQV